MTAPTIDPVPTVADADGAVMAISLAGRCSNGAERGAGRLMHAVPVAQIRRDGGFLQVHGRALCGAEPGPRSVGWSSTAGTTVTCGRCRAKLTVTP